MKAPNTSDGKIFIFKIGWGKGAVRQIGQINEGEGLGKKVQNGGRKIGSVSGSVNLYDSRPPLDVLIKKLH